MKNYRYQKTFLLLTYIEQTSYFEVAPPGHTIAYKNVDNLSKNDKEMFKKCSNFYWFILRGFNFIKTVYKLFDNPSYIFKA